MRQFIDLMQNGLEKELPSGLKVRLRPVDSGQILSSKRIPENLLVTVHRMMEDVKGGVDETEAALNAVRENTDGEFSKQANLYVDMRAYGEAVALHCFIEPRIVEDPKNENEIRLDWLPTEDCIELGNWVGVAFKQLESFRFKTKAELESLQSGKTNLPDAESGLRNESVSEEFVSSQEPAVGSITVVSSSD